MVQRRFIGLVAAAVVTVGGGTAAVVWHGDDEPAAVARFYDPPVAAEPPVGEEPVAETAAVVDQPVRKAKPQRAISRGIDLAAENAKADLPQRDTEPFSMVSVTWTDPKDAPSGAVEVRTRSAQTRRWSTWQALETEESNGPDRDKEATAKVRGGTGAIWVGPADGVAARVRSGSASEPLPAGLRLNLIDPGRPGAATPAQKGGGQGGAAIAFPAYKTRAEWGADETLVENPAEYATDVKVQFVHHTAGVNTYTCADSPAILRGILTNHVTNRGWNDIGYNFLVDKSGTLFEGRKGGVDRPVIGAHTYGFNTGSSGIAVLGDYRTIGVPDVVKTVIARVAAAKLGQYNLSPIGTSKLTEGVSDGKFPLGTVVDFQRVSGHRDGVNTECPGDTLYGQLPSIRSLAGGSDGSIVAQAPTGGRAYNGSYYVKNTVTMNWTTTTPQESLAKFELLVDGVVKATATADARSAPVALTAGTRKVQVRSVRTDGGTAITPATTVVADDKAPVFNPGLSVEPRTGTVSTTVVPVSVKWKVTDNVRLASVRLVSPSAVSFGGTATSYATTVRPATATTWTMRVADLPGNTAESSMARTATLVPETSATRYKTWTAKSNTSYLNGKALYSATAKARLTWTFSGRGVGVIVGRTSTSGKIDIYVDAQKRATIDTRTSGSSYRQMIWTMATGSGRHSIAIINTGAAGRSGVTIDGIAHLS